MTREQFIARFTRHASPDAKQDKAGTAYAAVAVAGAAFASALFDVVPSRPDLEEAMRNALAHIDAAVDCTVEALEGRAKEPVEQAPTFAPDSEPLPLPPTSDLDPEPPTGADTVGAEA